MLLPRLPWYAWGALGAGLLLVLGGTAAGAAAPPTRPSGAPPTLRKGSSGPWVSYLQGLLGKAQTGTFDAATDAAVRALQTSKGLTSDGIVGRGTWGALGETIPQGGGVIGPPAPVAPSPVTGPIVPAVPTSGNPFGLSDNIAAREAQILSFVQQGKIDHDWIPLDYDKDGHHVSALVSRRALALSDGGERLTVNVTYPTAQKIADAIGGAMLTTRLSDEIWRTADARLPVLAKNWNTASPPTGSNTRRMYDQSAHIEQSLGGAGGLVANEGKDWIITRRFWTDPEPRRHHSANFGWYPGGSRSPGGESVVQSVGLAHDMGHTDYSQLLRFVRRGSLTIDGQPWGWDEALADPSVSDLIQDEGATIPSSRHPDLE